MWAGGTSETVWVVGSVEPGAGAGLAYKLVEMTVDGSTKRAKVSSSWSIANPCQSSHYFDPGGISGTSNRRVWIVGTCTPKQPKQPEQAFVLHFDGTKVSAVTDIPNLTGASLATVYALPGGEVWAAGSAVLHRARDGTWTWMLREKDSSTPGGVWAAGAGDGSGAHDLWVGTLRYFHGAGAR